METTYEEALQASRAEAMRWAQEDLVERARERARGIICAVRRIKPPTRTQAALAAAAVMVVLLALAAALPTPAAAFDIPGIGEFDFNKMLAGIFKAPIEVIFGATINMLKWINTDNMITGTFDGMIGTSKHNVASVVINLGNGTIMSAAKTFLAIVVLVRLLEVARRMDQQGGTMPAVREVLSLFGFYVVSLLLVSRAPDIMEGLFTALQAIIRSINGSMSADDIGKLEFTLPDGLNDLGQMFLFLVLGIIMFLAALVAAVIAQFMAVGRAIEIYILTMFAPIPMAFLTYDGTRQWGLGYIKNYMAVCLSGAVIIAILFMFPLVFSSLVDTTTFNQLDLKTDAWPIQMLACLFVLIFSLLKSGSIANKILGGA